MSVARINIAVVGDTGVGKSTLINEVLGEARAATGIGPPVTVETNYYAHESEPVGLWDFCGFEHGSEVSPVDALRETLAEIQAGDAARAIHVAWFCWDASSARLTDGHKALIRVLDSAGVPVLGILTKVQKSGARVKSAHRAFARYIERENLGLAEARVFLTAADADAHFGFERHGIDKLLRATLAVSGDGAVPTPPVSKRAAAVASARNVGRGAKPLGSKAAARIAKLRP